MGSQHSTGAESHTLFILNAVHGVQVFRAAPFTDIVPFIEDRFNVPKAVAVQKILGPGNVLHIFPWAGAVAVPGEEVQRNLVFLGIAEEVLHQLSFFCASAAGKGGAADLQLWEAALQMLGHHLIKFQEQLLGAAPAGVAVGGIVAIRLVPNFPVNDRQLHAVRPAVAVVSDDVFTDPGILMKILGRQGLVLLDLMLDLAAQTVENGGSAFVGLSDVFIREGKVIIRRIVLVSIKIGEDIQHIMAVGAAVLGSKRCIVVPAARKSCFPKQFHACRNGAVIDGVHGLYFSGDLRKIHLYGIHSVSFL